jgi:hypothetical protein
MPALGEIEVKGAKELERAFRQLRREVLRELRPELRLIGNVVRVEAETLAGERISHIGPRWSKMRLGVTASGVYVAPRARRAGGSPRPNLAGLLMDRAMQPALDEHEEEVVRQFDGLISRAADRAGF